jgi:hypothetical protein
MMAGMPGMPGMPGMGMPGLPMMPANHIAGGPGMSPVMQASCTTCGPAPAAAPGCSAFAPSGLVHAMGANMGMGMPMGGAPAVSQRSQIRFVGPAGAKIGWYVAAASEKDGKPTMMPHQLDVPSRYNFIQASIYRLKLFDIPGRPGLELYPTIEVVPSNPKTEAFLAHNAIPVEFTEEDFDQITAGNYLTKVIYLPEAQYQTASAAGPDTLISTQLEPGLDPIAEAHRRGHILLVVRLGGINLETPNSPPLSSAAPAMPPANAGMKPNPAMMGQAPGMLALPGVAAPTPAGSPSQPPAAKPPVPRTNPPVAAPSGPMVPASPGTLPPFQGPGSKVGAATATDMAAQQIAWVVGPDGQMRPVSLVTGKPVTFPQTAIPAGSEPAPGDPRSKPAAKRGVLSDMFK